MKSTTEDLTKAKQDAVILRVLLTDWLPTAENINALPEALRKFIHDLEANADPAGMVAENALLRDTAAQLQEALALRQATIDRLKIDRDKYRRHNAVAQKVAVAERVEKKKVQAKLDVVHHEVARLKEQAKLDAELRRGWLP